MQALKDTFDANQSLYLHPSHSSIPMDAAAELLNALFNTNRCPSEKFLMCYNELIAKKYLPECKLLRVYDEGSYSINDGDTKKSWCCDNPMDGPRYAGIYEPLTENYIGGEHFMVVTSIQRPDYDVTISDLNLVRMVRGRAFIMPGTDNDDDPWYAQYTISSDEPSPVSVQPEFEIPHDKFFVITGEAVHTHGCLRYLRTLLIRLPRMTFPGRNCVLRRSKDRNLIGCLSTQCREIFKERRTTTNTPNPGIDNQTIMDFVESLLTNLKSTR